MTDGPFRISTTPVGNPCVVTTNGDVVHVCRTPHDAQHELGESLRIWHYAGGPRLLAERDEARSQRDSLLARIHRDGGHYVTQHGLEKAIEDAHEVSATRTVQLDEARALLKELEWCIPNAFGVPTSCPVCWGSKNTGGHTPDCRLAAAIKETTHAK